ncbi:hypothetical protein B0H13DRAFT_2310176 [Mycena leptocephala]|nr:hypothetical protein B0H13DRAFT_2310176 [Mycena leptocephala]
MNLDWIYDQYPEFERQPRRLNMRRMRDVDHLRPVHFKRELRAESCDLPKVWKSAVRKAEAILIKYGVRMTVPFAVLFKRPETDLLRPFGGKYPALSSKADRSVVDSSSAPTTDSAVDPGPFTLSHLIPTAEFDRMFADIESTDTLPQHSIWDWASTSASAWDTWAAGSSIWRSTSCLALFRPRPRPVRRVPRRATGQRPHASRAAHAQGRTRQGDVRSALSTWDLPALRNLSMLSANFSDTSEGFRCRSSSPCTGRSSRALPHRAAAPPRGAHTRRPDWITPHLLLPVHLTLALIGIRGIDTRLWDDYARRADISNPWQGQKVYDTFFGLRAQVEIA